MISKDQVLVRVVDRDELQVTLRASYECNFRIDLPQTDRPTSEQFGRVEHVTDWFLRQLYSGVSLAAETARRKLHSIRSMVPQAVVENSESMLLNSTIDEVNEQLIALQTMAGEGKPVVMECEHCKTVFQIFESSPNQCPDCGWYLRLNDQERA